MHFKKVKHFAEKNRTLFKVKKIVFNWAPSNKLPLFSEKRTHKKTGCIFIQFIQYFNLTYSVVLKFTIDYFVTYAGLVLCELWGINNQTNKHTNKQTYKQTHKQKNKQTDKWTLQLLTQLAKRLVESQYIIPAVCEFIHLLKCYIPG